VSATPLAVVDPQALADEIGAQAWAHGLVALYGQLSGVRTISWTHKVWTRPGDASGFHNPPFERSVTVQGAGLTDDDKAVAGAAVSRYLANFDRWLYRHLVGDMGLIGSSASSSCEILFTLDEDGLSRENSPVTVRPR
jgi:hypothetical protein